LNQPFKDPDAERITVWLVESPQVGRSPEMMFFLKWIAWFH